MRSLQRIASSSIASSSAASWALAAIAAVALARAVPAEEPPPNVVILFADDLGYGDLGVFGSPTIQTPRLDRMAAEGLKLTSFYAAPSCSPSRAALLTGRYPPRSGIWRVLGPDDKGGIPASEVLLPEALKDRGYRTLAVGKWHLGASRKELFPTENGFDEYFGLLYSNDMIPPWVQTQRPLTLYRSAEPVEHPVDQATLTERYTEEAIRFIRAAKGGPFFVYLAYAMPHVPLHASERFRGRSRRGLLGDVVETIDWSAGRILDTLAEEGIERRTLVVFTSDNGPWLHMPPRMLSGGIVRQQDAGSAGPLRGWKGSTYEGGVRVPCIARWPGKIPPGRVSADIVSTMDLYATILALAGAKVPVDRVVDGKDITRLLEGTGPSPRAEFFYFNGKGPEGMREGRWKLRISRHLRDDLKPGEPIPPELFDLEEDPSELYDLSKEQPEITERLRRRLEEFSATVEVGKALD
jgi:arylsulfatase A-like enzyme